MTPVQLDALAAVRAITSASGETLLIEARLARTSEGTGIGPTARNVLSRAVGLASAGQRVSALVAGPLDALTTLAAAVGRSLPLVLHIQGRTLPRQGRGQGAGHDDLVCLSRTGAPIFVARDAQHGADLALAARRLAELALTPVVILHDAQPQGTGERLVDWPAPRALDALLGAPGDRVAAASPGQLALYGAERRRLPRLLNPDRPTTSGAVLDPAADARGQVAAALWQAEPLPALVDRSLADVARVTQRPLARLSTHNVGAARLVLIAAGSLVPLAEAVAEELRATRRLHVGVIGLTLRSPIADDQLVAHLRGRTAVAVLERTALPSDGELPLTCALRAAFGRALENGRARGALPHPGLGPWSAKDIPALFSASCGVAGHEPCPGDLAALVEHMRRPAGARRHVVLGLEFVRTGIAVPKLQLWQQQLLDGVPDLAERALAPVEAFELLPHDGLTISVHDTPCWPGAGAAHRLIKQVARTRGDVASCWPPAAPERLGQPTHFRALLASAPSPLLAPPRSSQLIVVTGPRALPVDQLIAELAPAASLLIEDDGPPEALWPRVPRRLQRALIAGKHVLASVSAKPRPTDHLGEPGDDPAYAAVAPSQDSDPTTHQACREATFLGATLALESRTLGNDDTVPQLLKRWSDAAGSDADDDSLRDAVERGLAGLVLHTLGAETGPAVGALPQLPAPLDHDDAPGPGHAGHFWERVGHERLSSNAPLADPDAAANVLPAASSCVSAQADFRQTLPRLDPSLCSACGECWMQCPDGALDPRAVTAEPLLRGLYERASREPGQPLGPLLATLARQWSKVLRKTPGDDVARSLTLAWEQLREKLPGGARPLETLDEELASLAGSLTALPLARTTTLFDEPEALAKGSGALLALTVDPSRCKACGVCIDVCPEQAFVETAQDDKVLSEAREAQALLVTLPPNDAALLSLGELGARLTTPMAASLSGGDGACAGCGEKTALRQTLAALQVQRTPLVAAHLAELSRLLVGLRERAAALVSGDMDLLAIQRGGPPAELSPEHDQQLRRLAKATAELSEQAERYGSRTAASVVGSEGCSTRWSSSWPLAPHTLPFSAQSAEDSPGVALGLFEGQLQAVVREAAALRQARALLTGQEPAASPSDWRELSDEELALCPAVLLVGGDSALGDAARGQLSTLLDSGRPLRIVVLDNQLAADCGGSASGASLLNGVSPASPRSDLAWAAMAQRRAFVLQSSPAHPEHLAQGLKRGFSSPHPALFVLYAACPLHHDLAPSRASSAARMATLCRVHPLWLHDPEGGSELAARLELDGNPAPGDDWVTRAGVPLTPAHWATTEGRFASWLQPLKSEQSGALPLHEHLACKPDERSGQLPWVAGPGGSRLLVAPELVAVVEERRDFWRLLREVAGETTPTSERAAIEAAVEERLRADFEQQLEQERYRHGEDLAETQQRLPLAIARRLARGLLRSGDGQQTVAELLAQATGGPALDAVELSTLLPSEDDHEQQSTDADNDVVEEAPVSTDARSEPSANGAPPSTETATPTSADSSAAEATTTAVATEEEADEDEGFVIDPSIQSIRCTTCNECTNLNSRMFAYNDKRQAYVKDPDAGTFAELVKAAEVCPVAIINPGTPRNPEEPGLQALLQRAARFG